MEREHNVNLKYQTEMTHIAFDTYLDQEAWIAFKNKAKKIDELIKNKNDIIKQQKETKQRIAQANDEDHKDHLQRFIDKNQEHIDAIDEELEWLYIVKRMANKLFKESQEAAKKHFTNEQLMVKWINESKLADYEDQLMNCQKYYLRKDK